MFHCGFEWPTEDRQRFARRIKNPDWPSGWFERATSGGEPWVFYMSDAFIEHCVKMIEQIICGVGAYCNAQIAQESQATGEGAT